MTTKFWDLKTSTLPVFIRTVPILIYHNVLFLRYYCWFIHCRRVYSLITVLLRDSFSDPLKVVFYINKALRKISKFYLISWRGNFVETHIVSEELLAIHWKLFVSTKFPHQEIRWNYGIFYMWWKINRNTQTSEVDCLEKRSPGKVLKICV